MAAATIVGVPKKPLHLPTNYRTHSGILGAAAAVVDVLREYFPMVGCFQYSCILHQPLAEHNDRLLSWYEGRTAFTIGEVMFTPVL